MNVDYSTTALVTGIKRLAHVPTSQVTFSTADFLALADEETSPGIISQIKTVRENYYLTHTDLALTSNSSYPFPTRAQAGTLAVLQSVIGNNVQRIARVEVSDLDSQIASPGGVLSFTIQGNTLVVTPAPTTGVIRQWFYIMPGSLVDPSLAAQIQSINTGLNQVTVNAVPTTWAIGSLIDFINDQPGFDSWALDQAITNISGTTITFGSLPTNLAVNNWLSLSGTTPIPQIPVEFRPLLMRRVAERVLESQGNLQKMQAVRSKRKELEKELNDLINPRIAEQPKKIVAYNGVIGFGPYRRPFRLY